MSTELPLGPLATAHRSPQAVAQRWRESGRGVVGVLGRRAPRELVTAAGMLPISLDPATLGDGCDPDRVDRFPAVPQGLRGELSDDALTVLSALLAGRLGWLDGLLIGRDTEAYTKLFYVIRELAGDPELGRRIPRFAFSDVLLLPLRTSAVYNRIRLRQLAAQISSWAGAEPDRAALSDAIADELLTLRCLRDLRRMLSSGRIGGHEMLIAERGAQVLPGAEARSALTALSEWAASLSAGRPGPRVFLTGSEPEVGMCAALQSFGVMIVGDDHAWYGEGSDSFEPGADPIDWLADRQQFCPVGAARSGLGRVSAMAERVRELGADAVLALILPGDEASGWELAELRSLLPDVPVISVELRSESQPEQLRQAAAAVLDAVRERVPTIETSVGGGHG